MPTPKVPEVPVDPNVKIPGAVLRGAAHAEAVQKAAHPTAEVTPEVTPPADKPVTPEVTPPAEKKPDPTPTDDATWERKYNSMKGRFDASERDRRSLATRVTELETLMAAMRPAAPAPAPTRLVTDQEVTDYGQEFLGVVERKARETVGSEVETLKHEVETLKSHVGKIASKTAVDARAKMEATLDSAVPNWKEINYDPKFLDWLALPDVYSGGNRHDLLKDAFRRNHADRVLAFFKGFLSEEAASDPAKGETPAPAATPAPKVSLETLAAPGRAKTSASDPVLPGEKPPISRAYIQQFYADVRAGKYRGKDAEKDAIEAQIFEATRGGRIV